MVKSVFTISQTTTVLIGESPMSQAIRNTKAYVSWRGWMVTMPYRLPSRLYQKPTNNGRALLLNVPQLLITESYYKDALSSYLRNDRC